MSEQINYSYHLMKSLGKSLPFEVYWIYLEHVCILIWLYIRLLCPLVNLNDFLFSVYFLDSFEQITSLVPSNWSDLTYLISKLQIITVPFYKTKGLRQTISLVPYGLHYIISYIEQFKFCICSSYFLLLYFQVINYVT